MIKNNLFWNYHQFQILNLSVDLSEFVIRPETKRIAFFCWGVLGFTGIPFHVNPIPNRIILFLKMQINREVIFSFWAIDSLYRQLTWCFKEPRGIPTGL